MTTISLCMIVKNEEMHLARCLDSIAELVDEIIVVDKLTWHFARGNNRETAAVSAAVFPYKQNAYPPRHPSYYSSRSFSTMLFFPTLFHANTRNF